MKVKSVNCVYMRLFVCLFLILQICKIGTNISTFYAVLMINRSNNAKVKLSLFRILGVPKAIIYSFGCAVKFTSRY